MYPAATEKPPPAFVESGAVKSGVAAELLPAFEAAKSWTEAPPNGCEPARAFPEKAGPVTGARTGQEMGELLSELGVQVAPDPPPEPPLEPPVEKMLPPQPIAAQIGNEIIRSQTGRGAFIIVLPKRTNQPQAGRMQPSETSRRASAES